MSGWSSSSDDDCFGGGMDEARALASVFDLSARSDDGDELEDGYLGRSARALSAELAHLDATLYAPAAAVGDAPMAAPPAPRPMDDESSAIPRRLNIDRETGLVIPDGTTAAGERARECARWRLAFPHLRAVGTAVPPPVGWVAVPEPSALLGVQPKARSAHGIDRHYALDAMLAASERRTDAARSGADGAAAAPREYVSLELVGTRLSVRPVEGLRAPHGQAGEAAAHAHAEAEAGAAAAADAEADGAPEEVFASHGELVEWICADGETADDVAWLALRPEQAPGLRHVQRARRWGWPRPEPEHNDDRVDSGTRAIWLAIDALEPQLHVLARALGEPADALGSAGVSDADDEGAMAMARPPAPDHCARTPQAALPAANATWPRAAALPVASLPLHALRAAPRAHSAFAHGGVVRRQAHAHGQAARSRVGTAGPAAGLAHSAQPAIYGAPPNCCHAFAIQQAPLCAQYGVAERPALAPGIAPYPLPRAAGLAPTRSAPRASGGRGGASRRGGTAAGGGQHGAPPVQRDDRTSAKARTGRPSPAAGGPSSASRS
jgi:hypothetical protein